MFEGNWSWPRGGADRDSGIVVPHRRRRFGRRGWLLDVSRPQDGLSPSRQKRTSFEMGDTYRNHPDTGDAAVDVVPSRLTEDELEATAVLTEGANLSEEALCLWARDRVPYFAAPIYRVSVGPALDADRAGTKAPLTSGRGNKIDLGKQFVAAQSDQQIKSSKVIS